MTCAVDNCDRGTVGRGYCRKHYMRWVRSGDPNICQTPKGAIPAWLASFATHDSDECLTWPFGRRKDGIGQARLNGKTMTAHHAMCIVAHGEPPTPRHVAAHRCGKAHEACVNQKHLRWATNAENQADRVAHDTDGRGHKNPMVKLSISDVRAIRRLGSQYHHHIIAKHFQIARQTVDAIVSRKCWSWLS